MSVEIRCQFIILKSGVSRLCRLAAPGMMKMELGLGSLWLEAGVGKEADDHWSLEPACQSGPDVAAYPELLPPTLGEHVEQNVSLATSPDAHLRRPVRVTALRRADVCAMEPGPAPRKHAPPQAVYPRRLMGSGGLSRHAANPGPDFRSSSSSFLPEKMNRHRAKKLGKGALDYLQSHPFCKKETLGS